MATAFTIGQDRRQVIGDAAIIEKGIRNGWSDVFQLEGERFLASFAIPGVKAGQRNTSEKEFTADKDIAISADDPREIRELKQIVNGMRDEMRAYLANGNGTPRSFWRRLNERTLSEMQIYDRTKRELENEKSSEVWEQKNEALHGLGLCTISAPNE